MDIVGCQKGQVVDDQKRGYEMTEQKMADEIKAFVIYEVNARYGYAGCMESPGMVLINSGKDKTITVKIEVKDD